ncbi:MAG: CBS domain-containing protein [Candidatus Binataceae bacterium]
MHVSEHMSHDAVTVGPDEKLAVAASKMKDGNFRRMPVMEDGNLIGIVSEFDLDQYRDSLDSVRVRSVMTAEPITVESSATMEHAAALMTKHEVRGLPVVDHGKLVGIITAGDMMLHLRHHAHDAAHQKTG